MNSNTTRDRALIKAVASSHSKAKALNLSENGLSDLSGIEDMSSNLLKLDLSGNNLIYLRPLSALVNLTELILERNEITNANDLSPLTKLEVLNLRGNCISSLSQLTKLASMSKLHTLLLAGNSIEMSVDYPTSIFALLPNIQKIDDWIRPSSSSTATSAMPSSTSISPHTIPAIIASPETHINIMTQTFDLQEQTLAMNGQELAEHCSYLTPSTKDIKNPTTILQNFPYYRLLQTWRKQVLQSNIQQAMAEKRLQTYIRNTKHEKQKLRFYNQELEAKTLLLQERLHVVEQKNTELEHLLYEKNRILQPLREHIESTEKENHRLKAQLHRVNVLFQQVNIVQNKIAIEQAGLLAKVSEKFGQQEARISSAADRLAFTAEIVAQRDIQLRNSEAAVQAEYKLLTWSRTQGCTGATSTGTTGSESEKRNADLEPLLDEADRLSAEGEAYLQAVFLSLDTECRGAVSVQRLVSYMMTRDSQAVTEAGLQLRMVLGDTLYERLTTAMSELDSTADLTYGELLLLLLPGRGRSGTRGLSTTEKSALREMKLLGDADWGIVPLNLPVASNVLTQKTRTNVHTTTTTTATATASAAECKRLSIERSFLMRRLQTMTRTLERRAEAIRAYFEDSIRRETLRADQAHTETTELQHALTLSKAKQVELEQLFTHKRIEYEETIQELRKTVSELTEEQNAQQTEMVRKYKKMLEDSALKTATLEEQLFQAKSSGNKREIKCRALERSLNEARSAHLLLTGEMTSMRQRYENIETELKQAKAQETDLIQAKEEWETERTTLQKALEEKSTVTTDLHDHMIHTKSQETERINTLEKEVELLQTLLKRFSTGSTSSSSSSSNANIEQRNANHISPSNPLPMQVPMQQSVGRAADTQPPHSGSMFGVCSARLEGIVRQAEAQLAIK